MLFFSIFYFCLCFVEQDILQLLDDVQELKPTVFVGVPRLYNRIHDKILGQVKEAGGLKRWLFETGNKLQIMLFK